MAYWCDDNDMRRAQERLDTEQTAATKRLATQEYDLPVKPHPDALLLQQLRELAVVIEHTYGRRAEITIWPKGIPFPALRPEKFGHFDNVEIVAPFEAVRYLERYKP